MKIFHASLYASMILIQALWGCASSSDINDVQFRVVRPDRMAIVVGNNDYHYFRKLQNPANDAEDIARALTSCHFEVTKFIDADMQQMENLIDAFQTDRELDAALFFYAGHAIQVNGQNFLIPIDAKISTKKDAIETLMNVSSVLSAMSRLDSKTKIIILDACRDNPFSGIETSHTGLSQVTSSGMLQSDENPDLRGIATVGLTKMKAPDKTILVYATSPGASAADGLDRNGLYTSQLLKYMLTPNLPIETILKKVRIGVIKDSGGKQVPWESSSLTDDFFFVGSTNYKLAILPWDIGYEKQTENFVNKIVDYIEKSNDFEIIASYYDIIRNDQNNVQMIDNITKKDIWIRETILGKKKPDIEKVCKIGKKLDADAVIVTAFKTDDEKNGKFKYLQVYLIDVATGKQCEFNNQELINSFRFDAMIAEIIDNIFNDYRKLKRSVAFKEN